MIEQILVDSLVRAFLLGLFAVGLTAVYGILKFANFYHVEFGVLGAYFTFLGVALGLNLYISAVSAMFLVGIVGIVLDQAILKRVRTASSVTLMIISFGVEIALQNIVRAIWGADPRHFVLPLQIFELSGARITLIQLMIIVIGIIAVMTLYLILYGTKMGKAMRAISDDPSLAMASGINTERVIRWLWFISASFASVAGVLFAMDTFLKPTMGFELMLPVFCAAIVGGLGHPFGAVLGALLLALAENLGLFLNLAPIFNLGGIVPLEGPVYIPTGYKLAISFVILVLMLLFRPSGILGGKKEG